MAKWGKNTEQVVHKYEVSNEGSIDVSGLLKSLTLDLVASESLLCKELRSSLRSSGFTLGGSWSMALGLVEELGRRDGELMDDGSLPLRGDRDLL